MNNRCLILRIEVEVSQQAILGIAHLFVRRWWLDEGAAKESNHTTLMPHKLRTQSYVAIQPSAFSLEARTRSLETCGSAVRGEIGHFPGAHPFEIEIKLWQCMNIVDSTCKEFMNRRAHRYWTICARTSGPHGQWTIQVGHDSVPWVREQLMREIWLISRTMPVYSNIELVCHEMRL
jgi:hypothetical protein